MSGHRDFPQGSNFSVADHNNLDALDGEPVPPDVIEDAKRVYLAVAERDVTVSRLMAWKVAHDYARVAALLGKVMPAHFDRVAEQIIALGAKPNPRGPVELMEFFRGRLINMSFPNTARAA